MPPKTIRQALADMLEDLTEQDFAKFCRQLLDRREEPRVRRNKVQNKNFLDIADVLVTTFDEGDALQVALDLLTQIGCTKDANALVDATAALTSKPGASGTSRPSAGATGVNAMDEGGHKGEHFVDKHKLQLTNRVSNIGPILDELLDKKVIQQESYDRIRVIPITQEKMRELYSGCLKASENCKDVFYEILEKNEKYLIADLKKND